MTKSIVVLCEGDLDQQVIVRLLQEVQVNATQYSRGGRSEIQKRIGKQNDAAPYVPCLCVVDLDQDECPAALINDWLPNGRHPGLMLRVAVRQIETWLLADRGNFAHYLKIAVSQVSAYPEDLPNAKAHVLELARKSPIKRLRDDMLNPTSPQRVGPAYNAAMIDFVLKKWNIGEARKNARSLHKALTALAGFSSS